MPMYEYVCGACGRKTEAIQRVGEKPLKSCPHCEGKLTKAFSAPAVHFKGSGWHVTDYPRAKKEEKKEDKKEASAGGESKKSSGESKESAGEKGGAKEPEKKSPRSKAEKPGNGHR